MVERECGERKNVFLKQRNYRAVFKFWWVDRNYLEGRENDSKRRGVISGAKSERMRRDDV